MKKILLASLIGIFALSASAKVDIHALGEYVYPNNIAASAAMDFMPDGNSYLQMSADGKTIGRYETGSGKLMETILDCAKTRGDQKLDRISSYSVSPDGSLLLVYKERQQIYRRTFRAAYYIFDIKRNTLKPLSTAHHMQQSPVVSPDGRMIAFMAADNNIYIHKVDYGSEVAVTTDGKINSIINGIPDWVYEEEFSTNRSMECAPDNSMLCYYRRWNYRCSAKYDGYACENCRSCNCSFYAGYTFCISVYYGRYSADFRYIFVPKNNEKTS